MIGVHLDKKYPTTLQSIKKSYAKYPLRCYQIFSISPRSSKMVSIGDPNEIKKWCKDNNVTIFVHSTYLTTGVWNDNKFSYKLLKMQYDICKSINSKLILHLAKQPLDVIVKHCKKIKKDKLSSLIYLEPTASSYDPPTALVDLVKQTGMNLCLDTAHIWCYGYDIRTKQGMKKYLDQLKSIYKKIKLIHFNGCSTGLGSRHDKHAFPTSKQDLIWYNNDGWEYIIKFAKKYKIPMIIEYTKDNAACNTYKKFILD